MWTRRLRACRAQQALGTRSLSLTGLTEGHDHSVEQLAQRILIVDLMSDTRCEVHVRRRHARPVQIPSGLTRQRKPEHPLRPAVALPKRMYRVERREMLSDPHDETVPIEAVEKPLSPQSIRRMRRDLLDAVEVDKRLASGLRHVDLAELPSPRKHVLEQMPVYRAKVAQRALHLWRALGQLREAHRNKPALSTRQLLPGARAKTVPQEPRRRIDVRVDQAGLVRQ